MLSDNTQDVAGDISVLQNVANGERNLQLPAATARLSLKLSAALTVDECLSIDTEVSEAMAGTEHAARFTRAPLMTEAEAPALVPYFVCVAISKSVDLNG